MAEELNTVWMPEYGREYWEKHQVNRRLSKEQLIEIAEGHLEREEAMMQEANEYLFVDTNAIPTYIFSLYYHGHAQLNLKSWPQRRLPGMILFLFAGMIFPITIRWIDREMCRGNFSKSRS